MGSEGTDPLVLAPLFVSRDDCVVFEHISDFVQTFENAGLGKRIDGKRYGRAAFNRQYLRSKVDVHEYTWLQQGVNARIHSNREQSILQTVLAKDISEACGDYCFETEIFERPHSVFSRATAAEVIAGNKNLGAFLHLKFRTVLEQMLADADFVCDLQKTSRNNLVRVDILLRYDNDV
jgi:hypothetical protein